MEALHMTNYPRRVGNRWVFPNGKTLPVVSGGDTTAAPTTVDALRDQRAQILNQIDDILNTAKDAKRDLTDQERVDHDALVAQIEDPDTGLDARIKAAATADADARRFANQETRRSANFPVPNINVRGSYSPGAGVTRSLDDMLWATNDVVRCGTISPKGMFTPNPYGAVASVDQVVIRADVNDKGHVAPRLRSFLPEHRDVIAEFQILVANMAIFGLMIDKEAKSSARGFEAARKHDLFRDQWQSMMNALDVDTSGEGGTWVPTGIGASMHEMVRASGKVAPLFSRIDIPTNPWKWPIEGADAVAYRVGEPTSDTATKVTVSTPGTGAATFDAEIFGARTLFSRSVEADSAIAILPFVRNKIARAFVNAEEMAILDGDADGTHQDTDVQALGATDVRTAWDGLRKKAIAQTVVTATTTTAANLIAIRGGMGKWGVNPTELAYVIGVSAYHDLIGDTTLLTVDKMGPNATILNGMVGSVAGVPVIVSEFVREDLNATGVDDGITATKTYNLCVNRNEWAIGQRMALDVEVDDSIYRETYQRVVVGFMREDFQHIGDAATNDDTAIAYNVTP
jgi:predicted phage gp36 major capsid-like protein